MKINLFIDMDGTVAKFYQKKNYLEKMYEKNFFKNLKPYRITKDLNELAKKDCAIKVYILSACVKTDFCEEEKLAWLKKYMPNVNEENIIFTKVGENKLEKAVAKLGEEIAKDDINILLDDYTENLLAWNLTPHFVGIKFINEINGKSKRWQGRRIKNYKQLFDTIANLLIYNFLQN